MASAEHAPITGVWGIAPSGVQGQSTWSGDQGAKPPEAESILVIGCPTEQANLAPFQQCPFERRYTQQFILPKTVCFVTVHWCPSWGPRVHGAPNPVIGGPVPPLAPLWIQCIAPTLGSKGKGKVFPYSLPSVGPGADPGVQAVSPQVT